MDDTTLKIAIAAFIHDIGKFADKEALEITEQYIDDHSAYLPFRNDRHNDHHAVYTAAFIEYLEKDLPCEFNSNEWGEGDAFINLAAGHHKPRTPMQQIITIADWLTSSIDCDEFDKSESEKIAIQSHKKPRLLPLFEQLQKPEMDDFELFSYVYPLKPLSPVSIFPEEKSKIQKDDDAKISGNKNQLMEPVFGQYQLLFASYDVKNPLRNIGKQIEKKERRREIVNELTACMIEWLDKEKYEGRLRIPLWNVLYNHR